VAAAPGLYVLGLPWLQTWGSGRVSGIAGAAELGVTAVVLGPVDHAQLPTLVAAAGVPVVARDLPMLREVFGGGASFATDPAGMAAALLTELGEDRRSAGRALARNHSWDAAAMAHPRHHTRGTTTPSGAVGSRGRL
jgi:glycosyltransferase involved in cell wall biosynthesis